MSNYDLFQYERVGDNFVEFSYFLLASIMYCALEESI